MRGPGSHKRALLALTIAATAIFVLGVLPLRDHVALGGRLNEDPKIYLPLVMKRYWCSDGWQDDFSDPNSGWPVSDWEYFKLEYLAGEFHVLTKAPAAGGRIYFSTSPPLYATNFTLEVDGRSDLGIYGLVFGADFWSHEYPEWYSCELGPGTYWAIYKVSAAEHFGVVLESGYSPYITSGMNHLKIVRQGSQIQAYVNGHLLSTVTDSSFLGSRIVGLTAGSSNTAPVSSYFDNFAVCPVDSAPGAGAPGMGTGGAIILQKGTPPTIEVWPR